jgi:hypothetical protein
MLGLFQTRVSAGDVVIWMGAATTHGAWAVTGERLAMGESAI